MHWPSQRPRATRSLRTENHTEKTGGGGLEPSAANPDYWDLVPYSENHRSVHDGCKPTNVREAHSSNFLHE